MSAVSKARRRAHRWISQVTIEGTERPRRMEHAMRVWWRAGKRKSKKYKKEKK